MGGGLLSLFASFSVHSHEYVNAWLADFASPMVVSYRQKMSFLLSADNDIIEHPEEQLGFLYDIKQSNERM